jgi:hypothetical protein
MAALTPVPIAAAATADADEAAGFGVEVLSGRLVLRCGLMMTRTGSRYAASGARSARL